MQPILIDEDGKARPVTFWKIAYRAGADTEDGIVASAVGRLGLIHILPAGRTLIVSLRPRLVLAKTMVGAFYQISDFDPERILLSANENEPPEPYYGCPSAFRRMYWLVSTGDDAGSCPGEHPWPLA